MKLEQSYTVAAPVNEVWATLIEVERVAPCLPGAEIHDKDDDGHYHGTFTVKLGPTTAAYNGTLKMESLDEQAHVATMSARGTDKRGQGGATATIVSTLSDEDGATKVDVVSDFTITGRLARFGRGGMIQDISNRLMRDFASCLQASIAPQEPAPEAPPAAAPAAASASVPPPAGGQPGAEAVTATDTAATAEAAPVAPRQAPVQPAKPVNAVSLFFLALWDRIKRLFARG